jgi:hypothetical protein
VLAEEKKVSIDETQNVILSFLDAFFRKPDFLHVILSPRLEPEVVLVIARPWRLAQVWGSGKYHSLMEYLCHETRLAPSLPSTILLFDSRRLLCMFLPSLVSYLVAT